MHLSMCAGVAKGAAVVNAQHLLAGEPAHSKFDVSGMRFGDDGVNALCRDIEYGRRMRE
jgi:hypothetical protein